MPYYTNSFCLGLLSCLALACVPVDEVPNDKDGFTPFMPDSSMDSGSDTSNNNSQQDMKNNTPDQTRNNLPNNMNDMDMGTLDMIDATKDMPSNDDSSGDISPTVCSPNKDGKITRSEIPLRTGLHATFKVATDAMVSTAGTDNNDGTRTWDLSGNLSNDQLSIIEARDPKNQWFSTDFPDASYITRLSATSDLIGVFQITDDSLNLLGVVSPEDGFTATKLTYDPPIQVLSFPVEMDKTWTTDSSVSGTASGVVSFYSEDYSSQVDAKGVMKTPFGEFDVLRVRVELDRTVGLLSTDIRTYLFVSECFGTVATIVSEDNERDVEFTTASEVRRLAP